MSRDRRRKRQIIAELEAEVTRLQERLSLAQDACLHFEDIAIRERSLRRRLLEWSLRCLPLTPESVSTDVVRLRCEVQISKQLLRAVKTEVIDFLDSKLEQMKREVLTELTREVK